MAELAKRVKIMITIFHAVYGDDFCMIERGELNLNLIDNKDLKNSLGICTDLSVFLVSWKRCSASR